MRAPSIVASSSHAIFVVSASGAKVGLKRATKIVQIVTWINGPLSHLEQGEGVGRILPVATLNLNTFLHVNI